MAARPVKRNGLFWELAADYRTFRPEAMDTVACPLCLTEYSLANIAELTAATKERSSPSSFYRLDRSRRPSDYGSATIKIC
jgi:hypothetical protein